MEDYSRAEHEKAGYQFVWTPHLAKSTLYETSGHLEWYADSMYPPMEMEGATYYPKPMNCPMHILIYKARQHSYRELPIRLFEFGTVYRFERSGVLNGLLRVRGITQDDAHIFCTPEQLGPELADLLAFVLRILRAFGLTEFEAELATRPDKFVGDPAEWDLATDALRQALEAAGHPVRGGRGGGCLLRAEDRRARARRHRPTLAGVHPAGRLPGAEALRDGVRRGGQQSAPSVHDPPGPVRFGRALLRHPPRALRRRLPDLAVPVQARILPVRDDHQPYAETVAAVLRDVGARVDVVGADEPLGSRVRKAKLEKIPYVLVVGDDDVAGRYGRSEFPGKRPARPRRARGRLSRPRCGPRSRPTRRSAAQP